MQVFFVNPALSLQLQKPIFILISRLLRHFDFGFVKGHVNFAKKTPPLSRWCCYSCIFCCNSIRYLRIFILHTATHGMKVIITEKKPPVHNREIPTLRVADKSPIPKEWQIGLPLIWHPARSASDSSFPQLLSVFLHSAQESF